MKTEKLELKDLQFVSDLQPEEWESILPPLTFYLHSAFCFPVKIEIDNQLVGIGTTIYHKDTVWLAHIVVHPNYRKQGIGRFITQTLIESIDTTKYRTINLIATDLGASVYTSIGFEIESYYSVLLKEDNTSSVISSKILPFKEKDREQILKLDRYVTCEDRLPFLSNYIKDAMVFKEGKEITGFYLPTLSDGLIIAENSNAGIELIKLRIQNHHTATLPEENKTAIAFLEQNNFREYKKIKRMRLGIKREWQPEQIYNRISGQVG